MGEIRNIAEILCNRRCMIAMREIEYYVEYNWQIILVHILNHATYSREYEMQWKRVYRAKMKTMKQYEEYF